MLSEWYFVVFLMSLEMRSPCVFNSLGQSIHVLKHYFCWAVHSAEMNISWIDILNEREVLVTLSQSCCLECFSYPLNTPFDLLIEIIIIIKKNYVITIHRHFVPNLYVLYINGTQIFYTSEYLLLCSVQIWIDMRASNDDRIFIFSGELSF